MTPNSLDRAAIEASVLRCGYDVGYFDKNDIENWAEHKIAAFDEPPSLLIELASLSRVHPLDVMNLLRTFALNIPQSQWIATQIGFLGIAFTESRLSLNAAIEALWPLLQQPGITSDQQSQIYTVGDGYDLAVYGTYGTLSEVECQFLDFVTPYSEELKQLYPDLLVRVSSPRNSL